MENNDTLSSTGLGEISKPNLSHVVSNAGGHVHPIPQASLFRKDYRQLSDLEKQLMNAVKDKADELLQLIENVPDGRSGALARTKLQETVFWAVYGITG